MTAATPPQTTEAECGRGWAARCAASTTPTCHCRCGGVNHGAAHRHVRGEQLLLDSTLTDPTVSSRSRATPSSTDPRRAIRTAPITGRRVPAKWPDAGDERIAVAIYGEAPGRYGADRSLCPFWGDRAAKVLYRALRAAGVASWDGDDDILDLFGIELLERGIMPRVHEIMLSNAYDRCPAATPTRIRPPSREEIESEENRLRLISEVRFAYDRGCRTIVALGKVAGRALAELVTTEFSGLEPIEIHVRPHPSALGLMQSNRHLGSGYKMADLEAEWIATTVAVLRRALARAHGRTTPPLTA